MALKIRKNCNVCKALKKNQRLLNRIYKSKAYQPGGETLRSIADEHVGQFSYKQLWNHCKVHQGLSEDDIYNKALVRRSKQIEVEKMQRQLGHVEVRQELVDIGAEAIRSGEVKMTAGVTARLLKDQSDIEEKQKDRQIEIMKMIQSFQSGEVAFKGTDPSPDDFIDVEASDGREG